MSQLLGILFYIFGVVAVVMYFGTLIMVFFENWPWHRKALWLLIIVFVPILGPMYYLDARSGPAPDAKTK
jgi:hypothetical protein